jgi:hypothetical protein
MQAEGLMKPGLHGHRRILIALFLGSLALNLFGDGLRDLLDPRLRGRGSGS